MRILLAVSRPIKKATQQWLRQATTHASLIRERSPLPHPPLPFLIPAPAAEKVFPNELHNTLQARKSRAKLSSAWQHLHSCLILLAPSSTLLSFSPSPLQQVAISHYPRLKRLQGVAASASSSLTNNTPTTTTTTAQHTGRGTVGRHSSVPVTFLHFSANGAAPSPHSPLPPSPLLPAGNSVQKLHQIHENIFQKLH